MAGSAEIVGQRKLQPVACPGVAPDDSHGSGEADVVAFPGAARSRLAPGVLRDLLRRLAADGTPGQDARPSRRRPRRPDAVTYRIRADLRGTRPPLWRRLEFASDLHLDQVHDIMQAAFGWTDSHLHRFASGTAPYGPDTEYCLCPFDAGDGVDGVPEEQVRLDEVLSDAVTCCSTSTTTGMAGSTRSGWRLSCPALSPRRKRPARPAADPVRPRTAAAWAAMS